MDKKFKKLISTYAIIPKITLSSDKKRQVIIASKFNTEFYSKLKIFEFKKKKFDNIFITDKVDFITLIKMLLIKKKRILSYNLELNSLSYQALTDYFKEDISNLKSIKYLFFAIKTYFFDFIKVFFFRLNFFLSKSICFIPSDERIIFLKNKVKINCKFICIKNLPVESDLCFNKSNLNLSLSKNTMKIINYKKFFFINGNINNYTDFIKILKYCRKKDIFIIVATNQNSYFSEIDVGLKKYILNLGYLNDKLLMYYIISNCLAGLCLYDNTNLNQIYSSSTKFYDFLVYNKSIIHSNNFGIKKEIEFVKKNFNNYYRFYNIDELSDNFNLSSNNVSKINKNLIFDNFYKNLTI
jgi:hypothetical protein